MSDPRPDASFDSWCHVCDRTTRHFTRRGWMHCARHVGLAALMLATIAREADTEVTSPEAL